MPRIRWKDLRPGRVHAMRLEGSLFYRISAATCPGRGPAGRSRNGSANSARSRGGGGLSPRTGRPKSANPQTLTAFRFPPELLARIDAYAERLRAEVPWSNATRADATRALLTYALERLEADGRATSADNGSPPAARATRELGLGFSLLLGRLVHAHHATARSAGAACHRCPARTSQPVPQHPLDPAKSWLPQTGWG